MTQLLIYLVLTSIIFSWYQDLTRIRPRCPVVMLPLRARRVKFCPHFVVVVCSPDLSSFLFEYDRNFTFWQEYNPPFFVMRICLWFITKNPWIFPILAKKKHCWRSSRFICCLIRCGVLSGSAWTFDPATQDCSNAFVFELFFFQVSFWVLFELQEYYYHAFGEFQPDLNYRNPEVVEAGELSPSPVSWTSWISSEGHERSPSLLASTGWPSAASRDGW